MDERNPLWEGNIRNIKFDKRGPSGTFLDNFLKFQIVESNPKSDLQPLQLCPDRTPSGRFSFDRTRLNNASELRFDVDKIRI